MCAKKNIFDIFTSRAKIITLRVLYYQNQAVPLRHISSISNLPIFSVQNAINSLMGENMLIKTEKDSNVLFELNKNHCLYGVLGQIFTIETHNRIFLEAILLHRKALQTLEFASAVNIILRCAGQKRASK